MHTHTNLPFVQLVWCRLFIFRYIPTKIYSWKSQHNPSNSIHLCIYSCECGFALWMRHFYHVCVCCVCMCSCTYVYIFAPYKSVYIHKTYIWLCIFAFRMLNWNQCLSCESERIKQKSVCFSFQFSFIEKPFSLIEKTKLNENPTIITAAAAAVKL